MIKIYFKKKLSKKYLLSYCNDLFPKYKESIRKIYKKFNNKITKFVIKRFPFN